MQNSDNESLQLGLLVIRSNDEKIRIFKFIVLVFLFCFDFFKVWKKRFLSSPEFIG